MNLPTKEEARKILENHVKDSYQRFHALMVAKAMETYAQIFGENKNLWFLTGYFHDLDYDKYPEAHPAESLKWFKEWQYPEEFIHAVEAHAYGYNGFKTEPKGRLAAALMACDEISGIFYAYKKLNPIPYGQMKVKSIKKRLAEKTFAAKIDRSAIYMGIEKLWVELDEHIANLTKAFSSLD